MTIKRIFVALSVFLFLGACASKPAKDEPQPSGSRQISLEARVQLQNKVEKKTYTMVVEAVAIEPSKLRLDLTGPFGAVMGKMVMRGDQVGLLVPQQRKAYFGTASENSFRPVLPLQLNPKDFMVFLFGETPTSWNCEKKNEDIEICKDAKKNLTLEKSVTDSQKKKWSVSGEKFAMTVLPTSVQTNVQAKPETFAMPIPEGYSKHKIP